MPGVCKTRQSIWAGTDIRWKQVPRHYLVRPEEQACNVDLWRKSRTYHLACCLRWTTSASVDFSQERLTLKERNLQLSRVHVDLQSHRSSIVSIHDLMITNILEQEMNSLTPHQWSEGILLPGQGLSGRTAYLPQLLRHHAHNTDGKKRNHRHSNLPSSGNHHDEVSLFVKPRIKLICSKPPSLRVQAFKRVLNSVCPANDKKENPHPHCHGQRESRDRSFQLQKISPRGIAPILLT